MRALIAVAVLVAVTEPARADLCRSHRMLGPAETSLRDTALDQPRSACAQSELRAQLRGLALIDTADFYGTLAGTLLLGIRYSAGENLEIEGSARLVDYRFAQNAVVTAGEISVGPLSAGLLRSYRVSERLVIAPGARIDLPKTDTGYDLTTGAATVSLQATWAPRERAALHGRLAALGWAAAPIGDPEARGAVAGSIDGALRSTGPLILMAGAEVQGGWYGIGLDHLLVRGGLRLFSRDWLFDLSAGAPLAGAERTNLVVVLGLSRRLYY